MLPAQHFCYPAHWTEAHWHIAREVAQPLPRDPLLDKLGLVRPLYDAWLTIGHTTMMPLAAKVVPCGVLLNPTAPFDAVESIAEALLGA
jgi:hypothetical protein